MSPARLMAVGAGGEWWPVVADGLPLHSIPTRDDLIPGQYFPDEFNTGLVNPLATFETYTTSKTYQGTTFELIEDKIFEGNVYVTGENKKFRNCWFRGPSVAATSSSAILNFSYTGSRNNEVEDSLVDPQAHGPYTNGVQGRGFIARRLRVKNLVDGINPVPIGGAADVEQVGCFINDLARWCPDTNQADRQSHSDGSQTQGGTGIWIHGSRIEGHVNIIDDFGDSWSLATYSAGVLTGGHPGFATNNPFSTSAVMVNAISGTVSPVGLIIEDNWIRGGSVSINCRGGGVDFLAGQNTKIRRNGFYNDSYYGVRVATKAGQVIDLTDNFTWNLADPMNKSAVLTAGQVRVDG